MTEPNPAADAAPDADTGSSNGRTAAFEAVNAGSSPAPVTSAPDAEGLSSDDSEELTFRLRQIAEAYPEDIFGPTTETERREHASLISRAAAAQGRHLGKFFIQAADELDRLRRIIEWVHHQSRDEPHPMRTAAAEILKGIHYFTSPDFVAAGRDVRHESPAVRSNTETPGRLSDTGIPVTEQDQPLNPGRPVPDGWKLVPREPTKEMELAGAKTWHPDYDTHARLTWRAMVEAAQQAGQDEGLTPVEGASTSFNESADALNAAPVDGGRDG